MRPLISFSTLALPQQQSLSGATAALGVALVALVAGFATDFNTAEIGRASCRERVS
jgi:hypothetical protein